MQEVSIPVRTLKKWAQQSYDAEVQSRATISAFLIGQQSNPAAARIYAGLIEHEKPEAAKMAALHFKRLLDALESGEGIREALEAHFH